ncbi:MAG: hypothetical protein J5879_07695 [Clostridia bacterium]|nr:hypothetical protein [Clostridia bacterium]
MSEELTDYEVMQAGSHKVLKAVLKGVVIALIVFVFGAVLIRSIVRIPEKHILYSDTLKAWLCDNDGVDVYYQKPADSLNRNKDNTFQFAVSDLYYFPQTHQLQITVRYNNSVLDDAKEKYNLSKRPADEDFRYALLFEDKSMITEYSYASYSRGGYRFVYLLFDNVDLDQYTAVRYEPSDAAITASDGRIIAHETEENGKKILYETDENGDAKVYARTFVSLETCLSGHIDFTDPLSSLMIFNRLYDFKRMDNYDKYIDYKGRLPIFKVNDEG